MMSAERVQQDNIARTLSLTIFSPVQITLGGFYHIRDIFAENRSLRAEIEATQVENTVLRNLLSDSFDNIDEIDFTPEYEIIPANVIAREPTFFFRTAIINVGYNYGIVVNMPVILGGNVVGRIISVAPITSQVQFLRAPEERISIEHVASGSVGILEATSGGVLFANFRSISPVDVGDTVHTTGLGGIYPRGFKIGTVERIVAPRDGDIFKQIYIRSAVDFDRLRNVFVVKSMPRWGGRPISEISDDEEEGGEE